MAENESLDLLDRTSKRWFDLCQRIAAGESDGGIAEGLVRNLYRTFRNVQKQFADYGIPLAQAVEAGLSGRDMTHVVKTTQGHDFARLMELEAKPFDTARDYMGRIVLAVLDRYLDQMEIRIVGTGAALDFRGWRRREHRWLAAIGPKLNALADKLAKSPDLLVRTPPRTAAERAADEERIMSMSLVGGMRRGER